MSKVVIESSTVKELSRQMSRILHYFNEVAKDVIDSDVDGSKKWTTTKTRDMAFNPQDFYYFRFGEKYVKIWFMRSKFYTLECYGFEPKDYPFFDRDKILDNEFFRTLYGRFESFGECLNAFSDVCHQITEFHTQPLF